MTSSKSRQIAACMILSVSVTGFVGCSKADTSQSLVADARQYQKKGDNKAAIIQLKNALQKNPDDADARFLLGTIYLESGDALAAESDLQKAISLGMSRDTVGPSLGKALMQMGKFQQALDAMPLPASGQPTPEALTSRGAAFLALGRNDEAKASFDLALKAKPNSVDAMLGLVHHAVQTKDPAGAMRYADQAVAANPTSVDALMVKGDQLRAVGKADLAMAAYDQALKIKPDSLPALVARATTEIGSSKFDAAKTDLDAARKVAPTSLVVYYTQALLDFTQGKNAAALESLQQVLRSAPENMQSILLAGAVQAAAGSNEQAEQYLRKYLTANPDSIYARKLLGSVLSKSGQTEQAMRILAPAMSDAQTDPQLLMLAGETYMRAKDYAKAREYFERANKLAPQTALVHTALAMSSLGQGESVKAIAELELADSINNMSDVKSPNNGVLLVMTRLRLNQFKEALVLLKNLEKEQPDNPLIPNLKGGAYMGLKDAVNARASFNKAIALQPTFLPAVQNLAQLDLQEKKPEDAKKRFLTVLEKDKKNIGAMTALASYAASTGKLDEATTWFERAVTENPDAVGASVQLGTHYIRIGQKAKALALAQKLLGTNPSNPDVLDLLAQAQLANDDKTGALATYGKVIAAAPKSALAQFRMASVEMSLKDTTAAMQSLGKAIALQPNYLEAQLALSTVKARQGDMDGALVIARQIQKQRSKEAVGYVLEGDLLMSQQKFAPAVASYEQSLSLSKNPDSLFKLHQAMTAAGRGKDADARLAKWVQDHPDDVASQVFQGELLLSRKQNKPAIALFEGALKKMPANPVVLNNLAYAYQQEKDSRALATAEKASQLAPDNPAILDTLAWILTEQGNTDRGLPLLQKAVAILDKNAIVNAGTQQVRFHMASAMLKAGDKPGARKELEQLIASGKTFPGLDDAKALLKTL